MIPSTNEEGKLYRKLRDVIYVKKRFSTDDDNVIKLEIIVITQENIEELLMIFAV